MRPRATARAGTGTGRGAGDRPHRPARRPGRAAPGRAPRGDGRHDLCEHDRVDLLARGSGRCGDGSAAGVAYRRATNGSYRAAGTDPGTGTGMSGGGVPSGSSAHELLRGRAGRRRCALRARAARLRPQASLERVDQLQPPGVRQGGQLDRLPRICSGDASAQEQVPGAGRAPARPAVRASRSSNQWRSSATSIAAATDAGDDVVDGGGATSSSSLRPSVAAGPGSPRSDRCRGSVPGAGPAGHWSSSSSAAHW